MNRLPPCARSWSAGLAALLTLGAWPAPAGPPGPDEGEVPSDLLVSDWRLGPFYVKPGLALDNLGWDDNVFLASSHEQGDLTATVSPGIRLALPFGDNLLSITERLTYVWFQDAASERGWNSETSLRLELASGSVRLAVAETLASTRERFDAEIFSRPRRLENRFEATLGTARDAGAYFEGSLRHAVVRFASDEAFAGELLSQALDRSELRAGLATFVEAGPVRLIAGGELDTNRFRFDGAARDADGWFALGGLRFEPEPGTGEATVKGDLKVGYRRLDVSREDHPDYRGLGARGELDFALGDAVTLRLEGARGPEFSLFGDNVYFTATRLRALLFVPAGDRLGLEVGPLWVRARYPLGEPTGDGASVVRADDVSWFEVAGVFQLADGVALRVGVTRRNLESNFPGVGYSDLVVATGFRYGL